MRLQRLREAFVASGGPSSGGPVRPVAGCPEPDQVWRLVCGELGPDEVGAVADHAALCPLCTGEVRAAQQTAEELGLAPPRLRERPFARAWAHVARVGARLMKTLRPMLPHPAPRWAGAAAALLLVAGTWHLVHLEQQPSPPAPDGLRGARSVAGAEIEPLVADAAALPGDRFLLRWRGPQGARYDLVLVTAAELEEIHEVRDLASGRLLVPEESLRGVAAGEPLLWRVVAHLPDGTRVESPTFLVELR